MNISFAICTHNEGPYVKDLLRRLTNWLESPGAYLSSHSYEIVIVDDFSTDSETLDAIVQVESEYKATVKKHALNQDFASHKNFLIEQCTGDWILNLDADEWVTDEFLDVMPLIIESNPAVQAYWMPRINTVEGLTLEHVSKWKWIITTLEGFRKVQFMEKDSGEYKLLKAYDLILNEENGYVTYHEPIVCWPDMQMRLFKNHPSLRWVNKVHEKLEGFDHYTIMPQVPDYAIRHYKQIDRQEKQNNFYEQIDGIHS